MKLNITVDSEALGAVNAAIQHYAEILKHPKPIGGAFQASLSDFDIEFMGKI